VNAADRRRDAVARIIRSRRIGTQEELLAALADAGFTATQATLSRDLARLGALPGCVRITTSEALAVMPATRPRRAPRPPPAWAAAASPSPSS